MGYNLHLFGDLYTMAPDKVGVAEQNIRKVLQLVSDHADKPLRQLRVLDLAAHEGGFAIEFARHGCEVVAIEARPGHVAKARFVKACLGLGNLELVQDDVRSVDSERFGIFDVVLCLGILYHLPKSDVVPFLRSSCRSGRERILTDLH